MVKIQVLDRYAMPVKGARVFVKWSSGGHSEDRTNDEGIADMGTSAGTAEYVQVWDDEVSGTMYLKDGINQVSYR